MELPPVISPGMSTSTGSPKTLKVFMVFTRVRSEDKEMVKIRPMPANNSKRERIALFGAFFPGKPYLAIFMSPQ
jgi:hypothetical protein